MKKLICLFFIFINSINAQMITGKAYIDNKLIYIEKHYPTLSKEGLYEILITDYFDSENKKFASIKSEFNKNKFVPDSIFEDFRSKSKEEVRFNSETGYIYVERSNPKKTEKNRFKVQSNAIHGQGFHNFIVNHFDELIKNKKNISIVVTSRNDFYNFTIEKTAQNSNSVQFKVYPSHFLLKQLVTPIELTYSLDAKLLLRFFGLSNIEDENGKSQVVEIKYEYPKIALL